MFVTHESIKPFIDNNSSILILGSFPSVKSREEFYYAHKSNSSRQCSNSELLENPIFWYKNRLENPIFLYKILLEKPI